MMDGYSVKYHVPVGMKCADLEESILLKEAGFPQEGAERCWASKSEALPPVPSSGPDLQQAGPEKAGYVLTYGHPIPTTDEFVSSLLEGTNDWMGKKFYAAPDGDELLFVLANRYGCNIHVEYRKKSCAAYAAPAGHGVLSAKSDGLTSALVALFIQFSKNGVKPS